MSLAFQEVTNDFTTDAAKKEVVMVATMCREVIVRPIGVLFQNLSVLCENGEEWFWFTLCLFLFLILGPFSAPIVLLVLFKLGLEAENQPEPESVE